MGSRTLSDELSQYAAILLALLAGSGAAVGRRCWWWWCWGGFCWTNVLRGRMREVSLLPSSLRLDFLLSATGFSFCSSSDWQSVLSPSLLLSRAGGGGGPAGTGGSDVHKHTASVARSDTRMAAQPQRSLYVHMHTCTFHAYAANTG